ncbi:MAG TPA: helix-turn-helix domain-containing protein [Candidatus Angelobacter sp.]
MSKREQLIWRGTPETTHERVQRHIGYLYEDAQTAGLTLLEFEALIQKFVVKASLDATGWNTCEAARLVGMHRNGLSHRIKKYRLQRPANLSKQQCRCGRWIAPSGLASHMQFHARRREVKVILPTNSDRFQYKWLREPQKAVA